MHVVDIVLNITHFFNIAGVYLISCRNLLVGIFVFNLVNLTDMESIFILIKLVASSVLLLRFEDILILSIGNYSKSYGHNYLVFVDWCMHILFSVVRIFIVRAYNQCMFPKGH